MFRKLRSFVLIERISEVTDILEHQRDFRTISERVSFEGGVADGSIPSRRLDWTTAAR
jgi:uncharacterized protein